MARKNTEEWVRKKAHEEWLDNVAVHEARKAVAPWPKTTGVTSVKDAIVSVAKRYAELVKAVERGQ